MTEQKQTGTATSAEVAPTETASGRKLDRRNFLRTGSYAGLGLAGAAIAAADLGAFNGVKGADALHLGPAPVHAAGFTPTDIEVLQFALNLEYLEAEFYSYAVTGKSLEENGVPVGGGIGKVGPTTGGYKVPFSQFNSSGPVKAVTEQLMRDEVDHVLLLRSALGAEYTISKPSIKLDVLGQMNALPTYLTLARDFEVTGVSAYGGAATLLSPAALQTAVQIALVEALHSGNIQLLCKLNELYITPVDALDIVPPPAGFNYFDDSPNTSLAVIRTPSQVLQIVYGTMAAGAHKGGFFPNGFNGAITTI